MSYSHTTSESYVEVTADGSNGRVWFNSAGQVLQVQSVPQVNRSRVIWRRGDSHRGPLAEGLIRAALLKRSLTDEDVSK